METLKLYFPGRIVAFTESPVEGVDCRDFFSIPGVKDYLKRLERVSGSDGMTGTYDYRFDANKFCRKVFAQDAAFDLDSEVFWFDADCILLKAMPEGFLRELLSGVPFCYFGRKNYTETGFLGFNTAHHNFQAFRGKYLSCFTTGRIFKEAEWHDCIAFDIARRGLGGKNLSPNGHAMGHVLLKSCIAPYIDHLKGKRKDLGYSPGHPVTDPSARADNRL